MEFWPVGAGQAKRELDLRRALSRAPEGSRPEGRDGANPAVYQHPDFGERAYSEYRQGKGLFTPQYGADLKALDQWLTDLEAVLEKVLAYFDRAP